MITFEVVVIDEEILVHPLLGGNTATVACEMPPADQAEDFWKYIKGVFIPLLMEDSAFLRCRILELVGEAPKDRPVPSTPFLFVFEWEDDYLPWTELASAAQSKEWMKLIEGGLNWQAVCYHVQKQSVKFDNPQNL